MRSPPNPGGGGISIAAYAKRIDVDNRIPLRIYFRIADSVLRQNGATKMMCALSCIRAVQVEGGSNSAGNMELQLLAGSLKLEEQADIYREEKNILDLYIMLLRFSSLVTETIPKHREYYTSSLQERNYFKVRNLKSLKELESIKPAARHQVVELNQSRNQDSSWVQGCMQDNSLEWPPVTKQNFPRSENRQVSRFSVQDPQVVSTQSPHIYQNRFSQTRPPEEKFRKISLSIPRAKDETLSRHSILGPNGLHGQWQPPRVGKGVQYPIDLDLTPIEFSSQEISKPIPTEDDNDSAARKSTLDEVLSLNIEEPCPAITPSIKETSDKLDIVRQPSPPPVLADVQDIISGTSSLVSDSVPQQSNSLEDEILRTESPLEVHISLGMMDTFLRVAKSNTTRNLETCGVLAGSLKSRKFYVTDLIIPKQESTSDSCQTTDEEEIFDYQDKKSLFPLGWIHTHPTQSCFMSSIDVHTHYSYQIMLPQAIAIVMAPTDPSRKHGIFRLTTPGGMSVIRHCDQRGFHPHEQPKDGSPIYARCTDVLMDPKLKFDVVDFR